MVFSYGYANILTNLFILSVNFGKTFNLIPEIVHNKHNI